MIQKLLSIAMLPLLQASNDLKLTEQNIQNNRDYYEVINATTGEKIEQRRLYYARDRVIQSHIAEVSAIKKALANEGIDPSAVEVLLYFDGLTTDDSFLPRTWKEKPHLDTITSPWLDLTTTITTSKETRITIRIDATAARLLKDLYSKPEDKSNEGSFLSIPTIKESCYSNVFNKYLIAFQKSLGRRVPPINQDAKGAHKEFLKSSDCAPEKLREPLISLINSSDKSGIGMSFGIFHSDIYAQLFVHCQDEAEKYYSELYPRLAVQGLQTLESESSPKLKWWTEVIDEIEPIKECKR